MRAYRVELMQGRQAQMFAGMLWERMDHLQQGAFLWDSPPNARRYVFEDACNAASLVGVGLGPGGPEAVSWLAATGTGCRTAAIHFASACASLPLMLCYGRMFLLKIAPEYDSLIAMLPAHWRGARRYCRELGFAELGVFGKACRIAARGRCVDGVLLKHDLAGWKGELKLHCKPSPRGD